MFIGLRKGYFGLLEMAQILRAMAAVAEVPGLISTTHREANNLLQLQFQGIQHPFLISTDATGHGGTYLPASNTLMHIQ